MTALVKNKSKGTVLAQFVSAAYVAMAGLTSIEVTGEKSDVVETVTLDGGAYKTKDPNGYIDPPVIKAVGFYDPAHATYTNLAGLVSTPVATNFKLTYADLAPTSAVYNCTGFGLDKKVDPSKMVMADIELITSSAPA